MKETRGKQRKQHGNKSYCGKRDYEFMRMRPISDVSMSLDSTGITPN